MIQYIVITSLCIWGFAALFDEGMILEKVGDWLTAKLPHWIWKPMFLCPVCMASFWGTIASSYLFVTQRFTEPSQWLILVFSVCGLNFIIVKWLNG